MAHPLPRLPTIEEALRVKLADEMKTYSLNDVSLKDFVHEQMELGLEDDEWTPFAEAFAAWAQTSQNRRKWSAKAAKAAANLI